jgi:hypothetical protein
MTDSRTSRPSRQGGLRLLLCALLFASGCQPLLTNLRDYMVPEGKRIAIPESGEWSGTYETEDLTLAYRMIKTPGHLNISGSVVFARRISANFPLVTTFHLNAIRTDAQGKVQDMVGLMSVAYYYTEYITPSSPPLFFNTMIPITESTRFIAFSYTGQAFDPTEYDGGGMDFWEYPLIR